MNLFNRVIVVLLFLALTVATIVIATLPEQFVKFVQATFSSMPVTTLDRIVLVVVAAVVTIASLLVIYAEVRPEKRRGVHLAQVEGARAELSTDSIAGRIRQTAETMPDVRQATPSVTSRGRSVDIHLALIANPGIDVSQKASEIVQVVRNLVEKDIGVKVDKLKVNIKYDTKQGMGNRG